MPVVHIVTTGGTIASRIDPVTGAAVPVVAADELVAQVPALATLAEIRVTEFGLLGSWNMTPALMAGLARTVRALLAEPETAGVVVTHGTDTMEESAFALSLLLGEAGPVVFTGAMLNASEPGFDGPRNLLAAVRVAADPAARALGTVVALNNEIHAARAVTKRHTTALNTFVSPGRGPLGLIDDRGVWLRQRPAPSPPLPLVEPEPRVYLVKMAAGMDDLLLRAALQGGARGVVVEASGTGNVYAPWEAAIADLLAAGIPVVVVSRCLDGRVTFTYGGPGGGRALQDLGVVPGGDLTGPKARLALMFALGAGWDHDRIRAYFAALTAT
ncbi:MAG: asparaginase [Sphaerobacter sp.]|nr:asparaginase [Sphaerobacter sp.]